MKPSICIVAALFVTPPLLAFASPAGIDDCKILEDDTLRLTCYDQLFRRGDSIHDEPGGNEQASQEQLDESSSQRAKSEAEVGAEQLIVPSDPYIEARLVGDFTGWTGKTVFTLDNGQVWQQTNNYIKNYEPRSPIPQATVTIKKGIFGSYNLRVEGVKRIVQVKRLK